MDKVTAAKGEYNSLKRLAYLAVFAMTMNTNSEKSCTKPFNSLLGETFEYVTDKF